MHVVNGHPSALSELAVDLTDQQFHLSPQLLVIRNLLTAGNDDLQKSDTVAELRIAP